MLFPMTGGDPFPDAPPTPWALSMRKWTIALWLLMTALLVGKVVVLDLFGALGMLLVVILGYLVPFGDPPLQMRWIILWGVICAVNCIFDFVLGIMHLMMYLNGTYRTFMDQSAYGHGAYGRRESPESHKPTPLEEYMKKVAFYAVCIGLVVPVVELVAAWLCYKLYADADAQSEQAPLGGGYGGAYGAYGGASGGYGRGEGGGTNYASGGGGAVYSSGRGGQRPQAQHFQAFQGGGQRLGGN